MKSLSIIISTANQRILGLNLNPAQSDVCYVVVHQVYDASYTNEALPDFISRDDVTYIRLDYPGLSKSRNVGLSSVKTKYAYIMDDDVDFDLEKMIQLVNWMEVEQADVGTCQHIYQNGLYPYEYKQNVFKHGKLSLAKVASIDICLNVDSVRRRNINFDERFGLGTTLPSGEEYIFLSDCLNAGLSIKYFPLLTGIHPVLVSGTDFFSSPQKVLAKREMLLRVFGAFGIFYIFAFWLKKINIVYKRGYFWSFTKLMLIGK